MHKCEQNEFLKGEGAMSGRSVPSTVLCASTESKKWFVCFYISELYTTAHGASRGSTGRSLSGHHMFDLIRLICIILHLHKIFGTLTRIKVTFATIISRLHNLTWEVPIIY